MVIFTGGAHGMPYRLVRNFDLKTGKILNIRDIISGDDGEIYQKLNNVVIDFISSGEMGIFYDYFNGLNYENIDAIKFYLDENSFVLYFDVYEAGPYFSGYIKINIPYTKFHFFTEQFIKNI